MHEYPFVLAVRFRFSTIFSSITLSVFSFSYHYFTANTLSEIGSKNVVTGIYLDYRLFDSLFEAGILFVVAAAILFMSKEDKKKI